MSNVKEQEQAQLQARQEAERMQKVADKAAREAKTGQADRQAFGRLVQQNTAQQGAARATLKNQEQGQASDRLQSLAQGLKQEAVKNQRLHKDGATLTNRALEQAKAFGGNLETKSAETATTQKAQTTERADAKEVERGRVEERGIALDKKREAEKEAEQDALVAEQVGKERPNAAIDASGDRDSSQQRDDGSRADAGKSVQKNAEIAPTAETRYTRDVQKIPDEIMKKLVDAVYVGVNEKGLHTFRMEMKEGVLQGGSVEITADEGKITLSFTGLEGHAKNMMESSTGELMKRMEKRGLTLDRIVFS